MTGKLVSGSATLVVAVALLFGCASKQRMGMVVDEGTGLQFGSVVEKNIVIDSSQLGDPSFKLRIRNTSGDSVFDLGSFKSKLEEAFLSNGYVRPGRDKDATMLVDINVRYSGQLSKNMTVEYAFLGSAAGGIAGYRSSTDAGTAIGIVSGATIGAIVGSYVTEDTYIVVTDVTVSLLDKRKGSKKTTISFGSGDKDKNTRREGIRPTVGREQTSIAAYAGGLNTPQSKIANEVRRRLVRILENII